MVKVNIIHMWDFTVMPLQIQAVEVKPTNQELQKQYFDFSPSSYFLSCNKLPFRYQGKKKKYKTKPTKQKLRKHIKLQNPQTVIL